VNRLRWETAGRIQNNNGKFLGSFELGSVSGMARWEFFRTFY
jgi:hypothetical protein